MKLGPRIRRARIATCLSIRELASVVDCSPSHLCRVESGETKPSAKLLVRLATALSLDRDEVFVSAGRMPPGIMRRITPAMLPKLRRVVA